MIYFNVNIINQIRLQRQITGVIVVSTVKMIAVFTNVFIKNLVNVLIDFRLKSIQDVLELLSKVNLTALI
nr:MAG TPA: hypothetical protein [Caudoviricetes sp.]